VSFFKHHRKVEHRDGQGTRELAPLKKSIYSLVDAVGRTELGGDDHNKIVLTTALLSTPECRLLCETRQSQFTEERESSCHWITGSICQLDSVLGRSRHLADRRWRRRSESG
jgi:hypothetical protein